MVTGMRPAHAQKGKVAADRAVMRADDMRARKCSRPVKNPLLVVGPPLLHYTLVRGIVLDAVAMRRPHGAQERAVKNGEPTRTAAPFPTLRVCVGCKLVTNTTSYPISQRVCRFDITGACSC